MSETPNLEQAVIDLQTRVAFQEDTLRQLDEVLISQNELIDRLKRRLVFLEDRLRGLEDRSQAGSGDAGSPADQERPPHY